MLSLLSAACAWLAVTRRKAEHGRVFSLFLLCEELLSCDSHSGIDLHVCFFKDIFYFFLWKSTIPMVTIHARGSD